MKKSAMGTLVVVIAISWSLPCNAATIPPASGGGDGCNPNRTNDSTIYQANAHQTISTSFGGVQAQIKNYSPYVSAYDSPFGASAWVTLINGNALAQIGRYELPSGGGRGTFSLFDVRTQGVTHHSAGDPINSYSTYKINFNPTPGINSQYFTYYRDGSQAGYSSQYFLPKEIQIGDEVHTRASQIAGGTQNHMYFTAMKAYSPSGTSGIWKTPSMVMSTTKAQVPAGVSWIGTTPAVNSAVGSDMQTWDKACGY